MDVLCGVCWSAGFGETDSGVARSAVAAQVEVLWLLLFTREGASILKLACRPAGVVQEQPLRRMRLAIPSSALDDAVSKLMDQTAVRSWL